MEADLKNFLLFFFIIFSIIKAAASLGQLAASLTGNVLVSLMLGEYAPHPRKEMHDAARRAEASR
jgi:hypothetical protein